MCLRHGRREGNIGSSKAGIKCTCGLKGKMKDWVTKEMKEKSKTEKFKLDAFSRSRGLIFIGQLEIYCPLRCNIRKYWDSMDFVLKICDREIFSTRVEPSSDRSIRASNWGKSGKKMTTVDLQLNIPVNHLFAELRDIGHTITKGILTCSFELSVTLRLPIIGEFLLDLEIKVKELNIPDVLGKSLSFISDLYKSRYVSPDVLESCLSKAIFHDKDTITYYVARMALDIYKHKEVSSDDLGKFLSKLFMKTLHEEEIGVYVARIALNIYNHKEVSSDDLRKFLSKLFMKMSHEKTGGVVTSSKQREREEEEMGVCVARMALDIYNHKEKVSSGDLGKFLSILFKWPEEKTGDYVAQIVLDLYKGKAADSRPAMDGLIEIIFRKSHPKVYRLLRAGLDAYEGKDKEVIDDLGELCKEMFPSGRDPVEWWRNLWGEKLHRK